MSKTKAVIFNLEGVLTDSEKLKPLPGAIEFVHNCRKQGLKTALTTSASQTEMMTTLEAIGIINMEMRSEQIGLAAAIEAAARNKAFDAMVNSLDVERPKPAPDLFLEAAFRIEEEPGSCWVIEESPDGIKAAKTAGMNCLALLTTFPEDQIKAAGPDKIAKDLCSITPEELQSL